jgi:hypothetical protein
VRKPCAVCGKGYEDPFRGWYEVHLLRVCSGECFRRYVYEAEFPSFHPDTDPRIFDFTDKMLRSEYEVKFNKWLHAEQIPHLHEPYKFELRDHSRYVPDFCLLGQVFFEIKGIWTSEGKKKFLAFKEQFTAPIFVLDLKALALITRRKR